MDNIFYPGLVSEEDQAGTRESALWPLITGIVSLSNGKLSVVDASCKEPYFSVVLGLTKYGVKMLRLRFDLSVRVFNVDRPGPSIDGTGWHDMLSGKAVSNLLRVIGEDRSSRKYERRASDKSIRHIGANLAAFIREREDRFLSHTISTSIEYLKRDAERGTEIPPLYLGRDEEAIEYLIKHFLNPDEVKADIAGREAVLNLCAVQKARVDAFDKIKNKVLQALRNDKWIVMRYAEGLLAIGKVSLQPALDGWKGPQYEIPTRYTVLRDFKLYRSLDAIDPEIKSDVLSRLTMDKVMLRDKYLSTATAIDPMALIPTVDISNAELGYHAFSTGYAPAWGVTVMLDA